MGHISPLLRTFPGAGGRAGWHGGSAQILSIPWLPLQACALDQSRVSAGLSQGEKTARWACAANEQGTPDSPLSQQVRFLLLGTLQAPQSRGENCAFSKR